MLNRYDFRCVLKVENVPDRHRSTGRLFQARGPATARARSPMVERTSGLTHCYIKLVTPVKLRNDCKIIMCVPQRTVKSIMNCLTGKLVFTECNSLQLHSDWLQTAAVSQTDKRSVRRLIVWLGFQSTLFTSVSWHLHITRTVTSTVQLSLFTVDTKSWIYSQSSIYRTRLIRHIIYIEQKSKSRQLTMIKYSN